jgi:small-conductance mechanosensitive channel
MLSNILATLIILVWRPFNVGEDIELAPDGITGRVIDINFMFTLLKTPEGGRVTVPNSLFLQKYTKRSRVSSQPTVSLAEQLAAEKPVGE